MGIQMSAWKICIVHKVLNLSWNFKDLLKESFLYAFTKSPCLFWGHISTIDTYISTVPQEKLLSLTSFSSSKLSWVNINKICLSTMVEIWRKSKILPRQTKARGHHHWTCQEMLKGATQAETRSTENSD